MYHDHFGIAENPFSITPDPRYLYMSKGHHEALAHLLYGVSESGGFVLLTGEVGTGKTSICRCLLEQLPEGADVALILNPRVNELELLASICDELDVPYPAETTSLKVMVDTLNRHLLEIHAKGRHAVVIIDEAQNLSPEVLEQVRLLTNLETATRKLLQIILIGQPELSELLRGREMRQLVQRITARYHLEPLNRDETLGYIRYRLAVGGLPAGLFTEHAVGVIYKQSRGIPRLINSLCDRCLLGAYAQDQTTVSGRMVRAAATEVYGLIGGRETRPVAVFGWTAAAVAAVVLLVAVPAYFGLFTKPLDWGFKMGGLLLAGAESKTLPEAEPMAGGEPQIMVSEDSAAVLEPAAKQPDPPAPATARDVPATPPEDTARDADLASTSSAPSAANSTQVQSPEEVTGTVDEVLVPAAGPAVDGPISGVYGAAEPPEPPETDETDETILIAETDEAASVANQIARAPAVGEASDVVAAVNGSKATSIGVTNEPTISRSNTPNCRSTPASQAPAARLGDIFAGSGKPGGVAGAMAVLFACWNVEPQEIDTANLCGRPRNAGLECLSGRGNWKLLAQINRPAMITLRDAAGRRVHVVVSELEGDRVVLLTGSGRIETDVDRLRPYWTHEYLVLWRPPSVYYRLLGQGAHGEDVAWLKGKLAEIQGEVPLDAKVATFDSQLYKKVVDFQADRGLKPDGLVGARTLININTVSVQPAVPVLYEPLP